MKTFNLSNRRYLGSKSKLINFIHKVVDKNCKDINTIADIFGGTGVVGYSFINYSNIIVNDILLSNVYAYETFFSNKKINIKKIEKYIEKYNHIDSNEENYYSKNFADTYLSKKNMKKVGYIRDNIDLEYKRNKINDREKACLITSLIYSIDRIANTVGHYDAYRLKGNLNQKLELMIPDIKKIKKKTSIYNENVNELVKKIEADLVYIDPPYNSRQYCDAYHFLENVARNEKPKVYGVAKKMDRTLIKSKYCTSKATIEFENLIENIKAKYILVSYNNTGKKINNRSNAKISDKEMIRILSKRGKVSIYETEYNLFTAGKSKISNHKERLFLCKTHEKQNEKKYEFELTQSPLNYTGGKYKLLDQLFKKFPKDIDVFYDIFCGGANVGSNTQYKKICCVDNNEHLISLLNYLKDNEYTDVVEQIDELVNRFGLSNTYKHSYEYYGCNSSNGVGEYNAKGYKRLKKYYNESKKKEDIVFLMLIIFSFNNQIRFNSKGEFNLPTGKRDFNSSLRKKLEGFMNNLHVNNINFYNKDFRKIDINKFNKKTFLYLDPPYYLGDATYNENRGWTEKDEKDLYIFLDKCNERHIRFALSNVIEHKNNKNTILLNWAIDKGYNINHLCMDYSNSNYHKAGRKEVTKEVLITNY